MCETFYNKFPNGVRLVYRHSDSPVAYVGIMVRAGTRNEEENESGMAHYVEHCVFKGTKTRSARQIIGQIEGIGGEINAYTTKEETVFYAATPVEHIVHTMRLIADLVLHPVFPKKETDKEVEVILDEIESYNDSPSELIYDDFENLIFAGHPLGRPILGTKKSLHKISLSSRYPLVWMNQNYHPDRMVVFVQGNIAFDKVVRWVDDCMAEVPYSDVGQTSVFKQMSEPSSRSVQFKKHTHQSHVMLGGLAYPLGHPDQLTLYMLNNILGGGSLNSRLNLTLREKKGLVYTVESTYTPLSDTGYWCVYFASNPEDKQQCTDLVLNELKGLREKILTRGQFDSSLRQLRGQMAIAAENQENNVLTMAKQMLYFNRSPLWEETFHKIEKITADDLLRVANDVMQENGLFSVQYV